MWQKLLAAHQSYFTAFLGKLLNSIYQSPLHLGTVIRSNSSQQNVESNDEHPSRLCHKNTIPYNFLCVSFSSFFLLSYLDADEHNDSQGATDKRRLEISPGEKAAAFMTLVICSFEVIFASIKLTNMLSTENHFSHLALSGKVYKK